MISQTPFRFIHASDLHLELPVASVPEVPEHLESRFLNAAGVAADRLFQHVRAEEIDFLVLSGGILDPAATGPRGPLLLKENFEKLAELNIPVYWAGSKDDGPEDWPSAILLPKNVHFFRSGTAEEYVFLKNGIPTVRLIGQSRNSARRRLRLSDFAPDPAGLFSIAVAHGTVDPERLIHYNIHYWALGGDKRHTYQSPPPKTITLRSEGSEYGKGYGNTLSAGTADDRAESVIHDVPYTVHHPGASFGRTPDEIGVFGVSMVDVHPGERPILTQLSTAPLRWTTERVFIEPNSNFDELRTEMRNRLRNLRTLQNDHDLVVSWIVEGTGGSLLDSLRNESFTHRLLEEQRREFGFGETITWPLRLSVPIPDMLRSNLYDQKTILGDYLRTVRHYQDNPEEPIELESFLPKEFIENEEYDELLLSELQEPEKVSIEDEEAPDEKDAKPLKRRIKMQLQQEILREAAMLGYDLLSGSDAVPKEQIFKREEEKEEEQ